MEWWMFIVKLLVNQIKVDCNEDLNFDVMKY